MIKQHLEFFTLDLSTGWKRPRGYPEGIEETIISGQLNEDTKTGSRTRLLRFHPGAFTTKPFEHDYWEEVFLVSGDLNVGGTTFPPFTYACRPPHSPHGPFSSKEGCLLLETHFYSTLE